MPLLRRTDPITGFWSWWADSGAATVTSALADRDPQRIAQELASRVESMDARLSWELARGETTEHVLVVTADGNPDLRATTRRWLLAAPPADETWSYLDARPPAVDLPGMSLQGPAGSAPISFDEVQVGARQRGNRLDVALHHPAFTDLDPQTRTQIAFLALDAALGENDVELWIGDVSAAELPPIDAFGLTGLRAFVGRLRSSYVDADGSPTWVLMQGQGPAGPVLAAAQVPLHPITGPDLDTHLGVPLEYRDRTPDGLPTEDAMNRLREQEDRLMAVLPPEARLVAHEMCGGVRLLHVYAPSSEAVEAAASIRRAGGPKVRPESDPSWAAVAHLRG